MTKAQEFRKQTEEAKFEAFSLMCKKVADLEKENAELKEYNKYLRRKRQGGIQKQYNKVVIIKQQDEQLTKAKKLLKKVVTDFHNMDCVSVHIDKTIAEAEQFLKDCEVEK